MSIYSNTLLIIAPNISPYIINPIRTFKYNEIDGEDTPSGLVKEIVFDKVRVKHWENK
jgi:hypothetical protein